MSLKTEKIGGYFMLKTSSKTSILISVSFAILFFVACIVGVIFAPTLVDILIKIPDTIGIRNEISVQGHMFVLVMAYFIIAVCLVADILLFKLLLRVRKGKVFTDKSVMLIRLISWCCIVLAFIFGALGIYFQLSFIVAFLGLFLGLCLRVTKNVIEEATNIKNENDLTI